MTTHSRILPWKIPWAEKPGRLESIGCRVEHTPQFLVMLSENGTFRRQLDHVGGALMMGLVPLEETGKSLLLFLLSALSVYNEKIDICKLVRGLSLL